MGTRRRAHHRERHNHRTSEPSHRAILRRRPTFQQAGVVRDLARAGPGPYELIPGRYNDAVSLPAVLAKLGSTPDGQAAVSQLVGASNVPVLSTAMQTLNGVLGANALGGGASVDAVQVQGSSAFIVPGSPANPAAPTAVPTGNLAVTGGPTQTLGFLGLFLLAAVVALRWLRRPATR